MAYQATVYRIMIASPNDVQEERDLFRDVITEWNAVNSEAKGMVLLPISWETHASPEIGRPQGIITEQVLRNADLLVAAFWTRIGTPTGRAVSGTVEEINDHIKNGKQAMLYFSTAPISPQSINSRQFKEVERLRKKYAKSSLYWPYDSVGTLRSLFTRQLSFAVQRHFNLHNDSLSNKLDNSILDKVDISLNALKGYLSLPEPAKTLLLNAYLDKDYEVIVTNTKSGFSIYTNGIELNHTSNARKEIYFQSAIDELIKSDYLKDKSGKGQIFSLTQSGLDAAEAYINKDESKLA